MCHESAPGRRWYEFGLQDLEGDLALVLDVVSEINGRHAALTQLTLDGVAAFQGCVQAGDGIAHAMQDALSRLRPLANQPLLGGQ